MSEPVRIGDATLYTGDVLEVLAGLPEESVHCVVTSPPYWGLRDYGIPPTVWDGEPGCAHEWVDGHSWKRSGGSSHSTLGEYDNGLTQEAIDAKVERQTMETQLSSFCSRCGAWLGAHGLEPTPELYVQHEVQIFRAVHRVLRGDGTLWLNLGASYAGSGKGPSGNIQGEASCGVRIGSVDGESGHTSGVTPPPGFKPKDMIPIPWMVAMALQADGWFLRSACPWLKRNSMPESCTDRPATAVEYIFLLTKSARYFYDIEAVRKCGADPERDRSDRIGGANGHTVRHSPGAVVGKSATRNRRNSDWFFESWQGLLGDEDGNPLAFIVNPKGYKGAHFATFPRKLVQPCILAGCPEHACPKCGAPWVREVEKERTFESGSGKSGNPINGKQDAVHGGGETLDIRRGPVLHVTTIGEYPTCSCGLPPIGGTVLDCFGGSGTVGEVALEYGRKVTLIELKPEYVELQKHRLAPVAGRPMLDFAGGAV